MPKGDIYAIDQIVAGDGIELDNHDLFDGQVRITASGGSGSPGSPIIRKFPFAFDTPGLLTGAALYTPTVGDILLDGWIRVVTAWDGTTPKGDLGAFAIGNAGWFQTLGGASAPMDNADEAPGGIFDLNGLSGNSDLIGPLSIGNALQNASLTLEVVGAGLQQKANLWGLGVRYLPAEFLGDPIKVCVSQDGTTTGADPGSTQGAAVLYLVTATPV